MIVNGVEHNASQFNISPCTQVNKHAEYQPELIAMIYEDRKYTFKEFADKVRTWAAHLDDAGVEQGDRVAYIGMNSESFVFAMFASWWIGATFMPFNFRLSAPEVSQLLMQGTPHSVVVEGSHLELAQSVFGIERHHVLVVDDDPIAPPTGDVPIYWSKSSSLQGIDTSGVYKPQARVMSDLALLLFTSGTTGLPKGVQLTFGNLWWNSTNVDTMVDTRPGDVTLAAAPLFHVGALNSFVIRSFYRGNTVVIHRNFDPGKVMEDVERYQIASSFLVPAQLQAMYNHEKFAEADLSSMRAIICAGAPVPPVLIREYMEKGLVVQQAWGLTETSPFATYLPPRMTEEKLGSCGFPMPYTQVKLVDPDTGESIEEVGRTGEMWVKGPNVATGYWNNPEATQKAYTAGWFHSGDLGYVDEDGYYFIVDRLKDMIISGGENVYPAEVERVLAEHEDILGSAVVGSPDEKWGESVVAVVHPRDGVNVTLESIQTHCGKHLARYKLPRKVIVVDEIPRNSAGKLDKLKIRTMVREILSSELADEVQGTKV
ncbi:acyl-CoA synthetase [Corynebacterium lubricantis]|uniref:acyl-CoA synthetase n=1 Tax=Corynebacterium lubricantis TaxID=541095 RepID=UPI00036A5446|nr:long-chain fatty acid--CoA ligase [Corynebacterium lubricantis]